MAYDPCNQLKPMHRVLVLWPAKSDPHARMLDRTRMVAVLGDAAYRDWHQLV